MPSSSIRRRRTTLGEHAESGGAATFINRAGEVGICLFVQVNKSVVAVRVEVRMTYRGEPELKPRNMNYKEEKLDE